MIQSPTIEKTLVISTGHISKNDMRLLDNTKEYPSTIIQHPGGYGTIIHISSDIIIPNDFSSEFKEIINIALKLNCRWINFDCDGDIYKELPMFNW